jgi:hypothetical protein
MKIPAGLENHARPGIPEKSNTSGKTQSLSEAQKPIKSTEQLSVPFPKTTSSGQKSPLSASNLSAQNPLPQGSLPEKPAQPLAAESSAGKPVLTGEFLKAAADGMGLPRDPLSVALLSIPHFFSMQANPDTLKAIRREILASGKGSIPKTNQEKAALEAETLAHVSTRDKGVILSEEALSRYARYLGYPDDREQNRREAPSRDENPTADELKALAEEQAKSEGFLDLLNTLPNKNGHYWLVFPFNIKIRGIEIEVFLRLLREGSLSSGGTRHLIADIKTPRKQWRCYLKETGGKFRADIRVYPNYHEKALNLLQKEAVRFLGEIGKLPGNLPASLPGSLPGVIPHNFKGFDEVLVQNGEKDSSWADDLCAESLLSVNKEV